MPAAERRILTVSQLNRSARQLLETHLSLLWVEGEISNLARPASGHCYFTLKDAGAQIRCAMFKNRSQFLRVRPADGLKVLIRGRVSLYEGRGDYQLIVEHMEDAGAGALQLAFEALRDRLAAEGLFESSRKHPVPVPVAHLAVITSATGAALQDILAVFQRRWPGQPIALLPVPVQGIDAAPAIVQAIGLANRAGLFDAILLARGGGSLEDLWSFNEEAVARAIAASQLPVITGIGHETDTTIADYVADLRAPTPSAAAELLSPDRADLQAQLTGFALLLTEAFQRRLMSFRQRTVFARHRLQRARPDIRQPAQQLDYLDLRLRQQSRALLERCHNRCQLLGSKLQRQHPAQQLRLQGQTLRQLRARLLAASPLAHLRRSLRQVQQLAHQLRLHQQQQQQHRAQQLALLANGLNTLNPLHTLARGFSVVTDLTGKVLTDARQLNPGDTIVARLHKGQVQARITHTQADIPSPDVLAPAPQPD